MANRARLLQRQEEVEETRKRILAAATHHVELPRAREQWWPELLREYGSEDAVFEALKVRKVLFNDALALIENVPQDRRGRQSVIRSNSENLLFLTVYLSQGVRVVESLSKNRSRQGSTSSKRRRRL